MSDLRFSLKIIYYQLIAVSLIAFTLFGCTYNLSQTPINEPSSSVSVVAEITSPLGSVNTINNGSYSLSGTCGGESIFKLKVGTQELQTITCTGGLWETQVDLSSFTDGSLNFILVTSDGSTTLSQGSVIKDTTPPTFSGAIIDGDYHASTSTTPLIHWPMATDTTTGVASYELAVGTTSGGIEVSNGWVNVGNGVSTIVTSYTFTEGNTYYISVRAKDVAGNVSAPISGNGWVVDVSSPSVPTGLTDGDAWSSLASTPVVSWGASTDSGSGLSKYQFSVGSSPGATDISGWKDTTANEAQIASGLSLSLSTV